MWEMEAEMAGHLAVVRQVSGNAGIDNAILADVDIFRAEFLQFFLQEAGQIELLFGAGVCFGPRRIAYQF